MARYPIFFGFVGLATAAVAVTGCTESVPIGVHDPGLGRDPADPERDGGIPQADASAGQCAAMDAEGVGFCEAFFGYAWDGTTCRGLSGCNCEGSDCEETFSTRAECEEAFATCTGSECAGKNPAGCTDDSQCGAGEICATSATDECLPSSCTCSEGSWLCTADCGGGVCVPAEPACEAMDAEIGGACQYYGFWGYAWNGTSCEALNGCQCVGTDCEQTFDTLEQCEEAFATCSGGGDGACGKDLPACGSTEYCDFEPNGCGEADEMGICRPRPEGCPAVHAPVCGCDGQTYGNACLANSAGVDSRHEGECEADPSCPGPNPAGCVNDSECGAGEVCAPSATDQCLPSNCACSGGGWVCTDDCSGGVCVSAESACEAMDAQPTGPCDYVLGVVWDGTECRSISGCSCEGTDCESLYSSITECEADHSQCG